MGYSKEVYVEALSEIARRKSSAEILASRKAAEIYEKAPELKRLDSETASVGIEAIQSSMTGKVNLFDDSYAEKFKEIERRRADIYKDLGVSKSELLPVYSCLACGDTGYIGNELCHCTRVLAKNIVAVRLNSKMPLDESRFDNFDLNYYSDKSDGKNPSPGKIMSEIKQFCIKYADDFSTSSENLLFLGATGLGKTHLSLAIAGKAVDKGYGVIYGSCQDFLSSIEKEHFGKSDGDTLESLLNCDLLILDDLGTEFLNQFVVATVYNIINSRGLSRLPTIISTNLLLPEIESRYGERILSRLWGNYKVERFAGGDIRQLKKMQSTQVSK